VSGQAIAFDRETGLPVAEEQAAQAVASGAAAYKQDADVYLRDPTSGRSYKIPAGNAQAAMQAGYTLVPAAEVAAKLQAKANEAKYGSLGQQAIAAAEGAVSGVTFGASDQLLTGLGADTAARAEVNPGTRTAGEVVGTVGSLFIPGGAVARGAGTAGRAARAATAAPRALARAAEALGTRAGAAAARGGTTVTSRLLGRAVRYGTEGAVEGAAYGAGDVVREAALKDQELTAEMLLSGAVEGAAVGGLMGGALGAGTGLLAEGARKLGGSAALKRFAQKESAIAMTGGDRQTVRNILKGGGEDRIARIGQRGLDEQTLLREPQKALGIVRKEADDAVARLKAVQKEVDAAGGRIQSAPLLKQLDEQVYSAMQASTGSERRVADQLLSELDPIRKRLESGAEIGFDEAWEFRRAIDNAVNWNAPPPGSRPTPLQDALKQSRGFFNEALDAAAAKTDPKTRAAWKTANADYSDWATLRGALEKRVEKEMTGKLVGTGDMVAAGVGTAGALATGSTLTGLATGAALGFANRLARERGHELLARAADRIARTGQTMDDAAKALATGKRLSPRHAAAPVAATLTERYEQARDNVQAAQSPQTMLARMTEAARGLEDQPGLVTAIHAGMQADTAYLASQLPQSAGADPTSTLTPMATKPRISAVDMAKFVAKVEALENPAKVLEDIANGKLDQSAIEALKVRRPKLYAEMRQKIMVETAQSGDELPYEQRIRLGLAFDFRSDPSLLPANMVAIQESFTPPTGPEQQPAGEGSRPGPSRKLDGSKEAGKAMTLPSERAMQ
jgi:hypothetical protein